MDPMVLFEGGGRYLVSMQEAVEMRVAPSISGPAN
jgi:hypothetical protein